MIVHVDYNHAWETQYNQSFLIDTDTLDKDNPEDAVVLSVINEALAAEDNDIQVKENVSDVFEEMIHKDKVIWQKKGMTIDEEVTLWWGE